MGYIIIFQSNNQKQSVPRKSFKKRNISETIETINICKLHIELKVCLPKESNYDFYITSVVCHKVISKKKEKKTQKRRKKPRTKPITKLQTFSQNII